MIPILNKDKKSSILISKILDNFHFNQKIKSINEIEYSVFSQFGDDGILSYLVNILNLSKKKFIEIGTEEYEECNTRLLLEKFNMSGLIIEGNKRHTSKIKKKELMWKYDLRLVEEFVKKDNIQNILLDNNYTKDIAVLSIDIDGNDYWIWEAVDLEPDIVVIEYNSIFGSKEECSTIYRDDFTRSSEHLSNKLYGSSIQALIKLAQRKNYFFLGTNLNGNNAYFLQKKYQDKFINFDKLINISKFREARNKYAKLNFKSNNEILRNNLDNILEKEVYNFKDGKITMLKNIYNEENFN